MDIDRRSLPYHGGRGILTTYRERERYPQDNLDASLKKLTFREQKLPEVDPRLLSTEESKEMVSPHALVHLFSSKNYLATVPLFSSQNHLPTAPRSLQRRIDTSTT